ncbi:hypothetical protein Y032_0107g3823 [Ancylostoma ceylanicum]|uniref:Uncharacterized protein n=1 Tax=Ancylostoma ceylanicum TaxID=53326 RepID=A0A016TEU1_9BILA|nr:hypothetical protein Y032_0107g3823 [Ancylostoma ceylanicum]
MSTEGRSPAPEQVDSSEGYDSDGQHETMSAVLVGVDGGDPSAALISLCFSHFYHLTTYSSVKYRLPIQKPFRADVPAFTYKNSDQSLVPSHKRKIVTQDI